MFTIYFVTSGMSEIVCLCACQLTGVLIGAAVAVTLIGVVVLFVYRRYKVSRECNDGP